MVSPVKGNNVAKFFKDVYKMNCVEKKTTISVHSHYTEPGTRVSEKLKLNYLNCKLPTANKQTITIRLIKESREKHLYKGNFDLTCRQKMNGSLRCSSPKNAYHFTLAMAKKGMKLIHGHSTSYTKDMTAREKMLHSFLLATKSPKVDTNWTPASW